MSIFNVGLFKGPKYSSFPWSHGNRISMNAGDINVIGWDYLNVGEKFVSDVSNVVRQAAMLAPVMDTYRVDVHAFAVRLRTIGHVSRNPWPYEDFFNVQGNVDGAKRLPSLPLGIVFAVNGFRNGTLFEQLGLPTFKKDREDYLSYLRKSYPYVFDPVVTARGAGGFANLVPSSYPLSDQDQSTLGIPDYVENASSYTVNGTTYFLYPSGFSDTSTGVSYRGTLVYYISQVYPEVFSEFKYTGALPASVLQPNGCLVDLQGYEDTVKDFVGTNLLDKVYELYKVDSISVMKDFEDWLLDGLLSLLANGVSNPSENARVFLELYGYDFNSFFRLLESRLVAAFPDLPTVTIIQSWSLFDRLIPAYPFEAYWKIISDWYINTAIENPDDFFLSKVTDSGRGSDVYDYVTSAIRTRLKITNELAKRYWSNDYFTSAFPVAQIGNAVGIPVNGTIIDLRNANAMQKLRERLLYAGSRIRDVWFSIWGKRTSAAIMEMSEVIGSWSNEINVDSVLQTSASENGSPQAGYAGTGLGYRSGGKPAEYVAEEPTVIMFVASISPRASYFQGLSRKFLRANLYDYAIPQLANVGEQKIFTGELYLGSDSPTDASSSALTFGYTRRNGDMMWTPDEVHGDFRGSLDYWHNARVFGSRPALGVEFLQIDSAADNLNRVFAVQSDSYNHFYCHFRFDGYIVRALPKHVHYDL